MQAVPYECGCTPFEKGASFLGEAAGQMARQAGRVVIPFR